MPGKVPLNFRDRVDDWEKFAQRHAGNSFLELDPLYALPVDLIDAIVEEIPRFFTDNEQAFERDLSALARDNPDFDRRHAETGQELQDMLAHRTHAVGTPTTFAWAWSTACPLAKPRNCRCARSASRRAARAC